MCFCCSFFRLWSKYWWSSETLVLWSKCENTRSNRVSVQSVQLVTVSLPSVNNTNLWTNQTPQTTPCCHVVNIKPWPLTSASDLSLSYCTCGSSHDAPPWNTHPLQGVVLSHVHVSWFRDFICWTDAPRSLKYYMTLSNEMCEALVRSGFFFRLTSLTSTSRSCDWSSHSIRGDVTSTRSLNLSTLFSSLKKKKNYGWILSFLIKSTSIGYSPELRKYCICIFNYTNPGGVKLKLTVGQN